MATSATPLPSGDDAISSPQRRRRVRSPPRQYAHPASSPTPASSHLLYTTADLTSHISDLKRSDPISELSGSSAVFSLLPDLADLTDLLMDQQHQCPNSGHGMKETPNQEKVLPSFSTK
ncbi:hypothetical protein TEA_006441 [Camellia sinensis var. sinensis]|uniref:Uncharacterized protein n=1 Tax=Camellia sinensis var. sinensis TaxID=542762 RepID=A0A4S4F1L7_CAMSN|nr:hypothetical protein TEA_006441 [Camellia sinensis var. sinensis]